MRARFDRLVDSLRTGFWFVPLIMLICSTGLAFGLLYADERLDPGMQASIAWAYTGGPEGARSLLSTIAGSMITAASVTFSLAAVALSLASQQYGSRVLRNFMRDRITQVLLGTFVATFIYCVLIVRVIRGSDFSGGFVPAISVSAAILLSLLSLVLLIIFVHHVSTSIQASHIVLVIAEDIQETIPKLYPSRAGNSSEGAERAGPPVSTAGTSVEIDHSGYLQTIDLKALLAVATRHDVVVKLTAKPGDYLVTSARIASVWGAASLPAEQKNQIVKSFLLGGERTAAQDIRYQFQQLTDVAVRALSPGINDPFTAINAIDEVGSGISQVARSPRISENRRDDQGVVRLIVPGPGIEDLLEETIGHIAIYARGDRFVLAALHRALKVVEPDLIGATEMRKLQQLREEITGADVH